MPKKIIHILMLLTLTVSVYGCKTTEDVTVRAYIQDKERIDQELAGNAGFLYGTPAPEDRSQYKETRKIYVLEFTKETEPQEGEDLDIVEPRNTQPKTYPQKTYQRPAAQGETRKINLPKFDDDEDYQKSPPSPAKAAVPSTYVEYKIEKDDTLQKISKQFYDSYSKWPRIYEANKDVISSPNAIKPGTVIRIPMN